MLFSFSFSDSMKLISLIFSTQHSDTVKPVLRGHSKEDQTLFFKTDYRLMQVKSIAIIAGQKGNILRCF